MTIRMFMNNIGQAFKKGIQNGNIAKGLSAVGMTAFGVGMTGAMIHDLNHNKGCGGSIFGGYFGNNCGCSPMSGMNMFGGMNLYGNMYNSYGFNPYNTQMGNDMAFEWGRQLAKEYQAQQAQTQTQFQQPQISKHNNEQAEAVSTDTNKALGEAFDEGTNKLADDDADPVNLLDNVQNGRGDDKTTYLKGISNTAKSYIAHIDADGDGYISESEFIKHELASAKGEKELSSAEETKLKASMKHAFAQMNLNQDEDGIDWKEMAASITTYDAGGTGDGKLDGKITAKNYSDAQNSITNGSFGQASWTNYKALFGDPDA